MLDRIPNIPQVPVLIISGLRKVRNKMLRYIDIW